MKPNTNRIELDWAKLLGFNQVKAAQAQFNSDSAQVVLGAKVGEKPPPISPLAAKIGAKAGIKGPPAESSAG